MSGGHRVGGARYVSDMMAKRRSRSSGGPGGGAAVLGLLLIVGFIIKFFWWLVAAAVAVGLFFAVRALVRHAQERRAVAAREAEEIAYRADRQDGLAQRGDARGVYGVAGAELMRDFTLGPPVTDAPDDVVIAGLAVTRAPPTRRASSRSRTGSWTITNDSWCWPSGAATSMRRRAIRG